MNKFFQELREKVQPLFIKGGSHSFDHTERVYNIAMHLAKKEKVDLDILQAACLLHDIARMKEDNKECCCHAEEGAIMAKKVLEETSFPKEKIDKVTYAIRIHRHSKGIKAATKEAEILQDADRLDALGAITIARMFSSGGEIGIPIYNPNIPIGEKGKDYDSHSTIHGFHQKILKLKPELFNTEEAKKIAVGRYKYVEEFLDRFMKEWEGKV